MLLQPLAPMPAPAPAQVVWVVSAKRQLVLAPQTFDGVSGSHGAAHALVPGMLLVVVPS